MHESHDDTKRVLPSESPLEAELIDHVPGYGAGIQAEPPRGPSTPLPPDSGEGWTEGPNGERVWGRHGAAGLLLIDRSRGVLLQHRAVWSHHGDTWGIPGGAIHADESPVAGALREAEEESCVPADAVSPLASHVLDLGFWRYTTVLGETTRTVEARPGDEESAGIAWVRPDHVERLALHPAFGRAWPNLRSLLVARPRIVIDTANLVGSVPDGWWRDRAGASEQLIDRIHELLTEGLPAELFGLDAAHVWPEVHLVLEGTACRADRGRDGLVHVHRSPSAGDDHIVKVTEHLIAELRDAGAGAGHVLVVTSDKELRVRVGELGAKLAASKGFREAVGFDA